MKKTTVISVITAAWLFVSATSSFAVMSGGTGSTGGTDTEGYYGNGMDTWEEASDGYQGGMSGNMGDATANQGQMGQQSTDAIQGMMSYMGLDEGAAGFMSTMATGGFYNHDAFTVDMTMDVFSNPWTFTTFTGMAFIDDNHDGIADMFQDTDLYDSMGFGEWMDQNQDGIGDRFQTFEMYTYMGMTNFVDVDGDGICDNYELMVTFTGESPQETESGSPANFMGVMGYHYYEAFTADTSGDVFINPEAFMEWTGMEFTDQNEDGIEDMFQNTDVYHAMGFGEWMDQNQDGIGDIFETRGMYNLMGMGNFVDVNGDGLSDNYQPTVTEEENSAQ